MTPDERRLRDAFLAEMWPTVREVPKADRGADPLPFAHSRRATCPACGKEYAASNLRRHINAMHSPSDVLVQRWQQRGQEAS